MKNLLKTLINVGRFTLALTYIMGMAGLYGYFVEKRIWRWNSKLLLLVPPVWPYVLLVAVLGEVLDWDFSWFSIRWG